MIADFKLYAQPQPDQSAHPDPTASVGAGFKPAQPAPPPTVRAGLKPAPTESERTIPVPTGFKPYPEYKESGLPWLGLCVRNHEISADILAIEKEAEGLLDGLLKVGAKT